MTLAARLRGRLSLGSVEVLRILERRCALERLEL
jgi:hypothetical protein